MVNRLKCQKDGEKKGDVDQKKIDPHTNAQKKFPKSSDKEERRWRKGDQMESKTSTKLSLLSRLVPVQRDTYLPFVGEASHLQKSKRIDQHTTQSQTKTSHFPSSFSRLNRKDGGREGHQKIFWF